MPTQSVPFAIDIFKKPYEVWDERIATGDEINHFQSHGDSSTRLIKVNHLFTISNHVEAACAVLQRGLDESFESFISDSLNSNDIYKRLLSITPDIIPDNLEKYNSSSYDISISPSLDSEIEEKGILLANNQVVFHGGVLKDNHGKSLLPEKDFTTTRPLSTSLSPYRAFLISEHNGKSYDNDMLNLNIITLKNPKTKSFFFKSGQFSHEREFLFSSGAKLTILRQTYLGMKEVKKPVGIKALVKKVPMFITHVTMS